MGERKRVTIHTDGACVRNPGPGGYGVVLRHRDKVRELTGGARLTTNNRMEVLAAIVGLEALTEPCDVALHSDSRYLVDAMTKGWAARWRANGWRLGKRARALNTDLWARLLDLYAVHEVAFVWVKGHAGNPDNERCDALAEATARQADLPPDVAYESGDASSRTGPTLLDSTEPPRIGTPARRAASPGKHPDGEVTRPQLDLDDIHVGGSRTAHSRHALRRARSLRRGRVTGRKVRPNFASHRA